MSTIQTAVATKYGDPVQGNWYTSTYTACGTIAFMLCGANSDLFGRRWFILFGNISLFVGALLIATSTHTQSNTQNISGMAFVGFGAGNCQLAGMSFYFFVN